MSTELTSALLKHWYLGAITVGCLVAAVVMGGKSEPVSELPNTHLAMTNAAYDGSKQSTRPAMFAKQSTKEDELKTAIADYKHKIYEEQRTEDSDYDMMRVANIYYSNFREYEEASKFYEMLLIEYPDFEMKSVVYQNLSACYHHLNQRELERDVYRRMLRDFPEGTKENEYAVHQLKKI